MNGTKPMLQGRRCSSCASFAVLAVLLAAPALADTPAELDERAIRAGKVFRELRSMPDREIPADLIARSRCVAVIPNVIKAAWVIGGHYGKGVLSCRSKSGEWSPPVHVMMTGGSFGLQIGASSTDVVLFFMTTKSVRSLLVSKVKLSGEAAVAAGPVGRGAEAATDARFEAQIYSYARSRGLFAGVSFAGGYVGVQREDTRDYYGKSYSTAGILFDHKVTSVPKSAWTFLAALPHSRAVAVGEAPRDPAPAAARPEVVAPTAPKKVVVAPEPAVPAETSTVLTPAAPTVETPPVDAPKTAAQMKAAADAAGPAQKAVPPAAGPPAAPPIASGPVTAPIEAPPPYGPAAYGSPKR